MSQDVNPPKPSPGELEILRVLWKRDGHDGRGMFHWEATRDEETEHGHDGFVEMEHAMADAEHFAARDAAKRSARIAAMTDA